MTREDVISRVCAYMGLGNAAMRDMDDLDWICIAMELEDELVTDLPDAAEDLEPPPPYKTVEEFADAVIAYRAKPKLHAAP